VPRYRAGKDVVLSLLDKVQKIRLGSWSDASEIKQHKWFSKINWAPLVFNLRRHMDGRPQASRRE
jgi:protein-serine/threonine kinase